MAESVTEGLRDGAMAVVKTLRDAGFQALWAGGCVRDQVLGLTPKDYDIATDATPQQVLALFPRAVPVGIAFGVVRVLRGAAEFEIATFRAEAGYADGRRPDEVRWADARADVERRDFTINGLLYDPVADELLDFVGGRADLAAQIVRAIGDPGARFAEDQLRILRAIRFAARFGFAIDPETWRAVVAAAHRITTVSAERVGEELTRILTEGGAARGVRLLHDAGLLARLLPEVAPSVTAVQARFGHVAAVDPATGWGLTLLDVADSDATVEALGKRLRFSRRRTRAIAGGIRAARAMVGYDSLGVAGRKRLARSEAFATGVAIARAAVATGQAQAAPVYAAAEDADRWGDAELRPALLLTGADLVAAGYAPGPSFALALTAVEDAQLEGRATDPAEALAVARAVLDA